MSRHLDDMQSIGGTPLVVKAFRAVQVEPSAETVDLAWASVPSPDEETFARRETLPQFLPT